MRGRRGHRLVATAAIGAQQAAGSQRDGQERRQGLGVLPRPGPEACAGGGCQPPRHAPGPQEGRRLQIEGVGWWPLRPATVARQGAAGWAAGRRGPSVSPRQGMGACAGRGRQVAVKRPPADTARMHVCVLNPQSHRWLACMAGRRAGTWRLGHRVAPGCTADTTQCSHPIATRRQVATWWTWWQPGGNRAARMRRVC